MPLAENLLIGFLSGIVFVSVGGGAEGGRAALAADAKAPPPAVTPEGAEYFEKQIRPLLLARCTGCHSASGNAAGGLVLDTRAGLLKGGSSGAILAPGDPEKSRLIAAVR